MIHEFLFFQFAQGPYGTGSCTPRCLDLSCLCTGQRIHELFFLLCTSSTHYAYVTGSGKPTICVNNMDRAVDLRVRLVIPSNYPQGTVFLSSAHVFVSYSRIYVRCHYAQGRHYARGTGSCKLVRPCVLVICTGQWIHEFRLVTPRSYAQGTLFLSSAPFFFAYC